MTQHTPDVVAAARVLCKRGAEICNVDEADSWEAYGADYLEDAALALAAAAPETAAERDRLRALNAELVEALHVARNGLAWYQDTFQNVTDGSDDEAMAQIDGAISRATGA